MLVHSYCTFIVYCGSCIFRNNGDLKHVSCFICYWIKWLLKNTKLKDLGVVFLWLNHMFSLHITMILCFETPIMWKENMYNCNENRKLEWLAVLQVWCLEFWKCRPSCLHLYFWTALLFGITHARLPVWPADIQHVCQLPLAQWTSRFSSLQEEWTPGIKQIEIIWNHQQNQMYNSRGVYGSHDDSVILLYFHIQS